MLQMDHLNKAILRAQKNRSHLVFFLERQENWAELESYPSLNLNALLSERLLEFPRQSRVREAAPLVHQLVDEVDESTVLLHDIEILFDRSLAIDPIRLLTACSKNKTLLVCWPGDKTSSGLSYAVPSHPEYRTYKASDLSDVILLTTDAQLH